jgi:hypothetical protein
VSAAEILEELPKLTPEELEIVYHRAIELHQGQTMEPSSELLAAIDEGDQSLAKESSMSVDEARRIVTSWNTK